MKPKHQRLLFTGFSVTFLVAAVLLTLQAFRENIVFFYSPTELAGQPPGSATIRLGGLVKPGSLQQSGEEYRFVVTDGAADVPVHYKGLAPNLFREGQGVVAEGTLRDGGQFEAKNILAKHDETYMPREVVDSLKKTGVWKGDAR